jgi:hypothetical protein
MAMYYTPFPPSSSQAEVYAQLGAQDRAIAESHQPFFHNLEIFASILYPSLFLLYILAWILAIILVIGWWKNLFKIIHSALNKGEITPMMAARTIGIFVPILGAILGYINDKPEAEDEDVVKTKVNRERIYNRLKEHQKIEPFL